ncbi:hypothetical protein QBC44DRAFT_392529 [Cladorrhinum sp. PSN332]|nr:hypothetical protein QBC44DRAFT_392529 [Cladorrhinum sp. PSN332]
MDSAWSTQSETVQFRVHVGIWTNWSKGRVLGSTLTLSRGDGNLLIAFTAFFVSLVATRLWRIACLVLHHCHSSLRPKDGIHHQRQAILRNSASPGAAVLILGQLYLAWRKSARSPFVRSLPAILFALACLCTFALVTGFSSQIASAIANDVLVDGANCTLVTNLGNLGDDNVQEAAIIYAEKAKLRSKAMAYSQQCYPAGDAAALLKWRETRTGIFDCASYVVGRLPAKVIDTNASCPFAGGICVGNNSNVLLDTGFIDSHHHIGLNAPPDERFRLRQVFHCAPIRTDGYTNRSVGVYSNTTYTSYYYGQVEVFENQGTTKALLNRTIQVEDPQSLVVKHKEHADTGANNFAIDARTYYALNESEGQRVSDYFPIPELRRTDGDVNILFLITNGVQYVDPTNDPWYRANEQMPGAFLGNVVSNESMPLYYSTEAASPMGCVEQFQFCTTAPLGLPLDSTGARCTPLDSVYNAFSLAEVTLFNRTPTWSEAPEGNYSYSEENKKLYAQFIRFWNTLATTGDLPARMPYWLGAKSLASQKTFQNAIQWSLPDDQWKYDVINWWSIWLAGLQTGFVDAAVGFGPDDARRLEKFLRPPEDDYEKAFCQSQKVRSTRYTSFSMFGLCFIYVAGVLIVVISVTIEPVLHFFACREQKKTKSHDSANAEERGRAYREWVANEALHLQQLSFQGLGRGTWSGCADTIPVTKPGEMLKSLVFSPDGRPREGDAEKDLTPQTTLEEHDGAAASEDNNTLEAQETPRLENVAALGENNLARHDTYSGTSGHGSQKEKEKTATRKRRTSV